MTRWILLAALCAAAPARAETLLALPAGAVETARDNRAPGIYRVPVGRFTPRAQPVQVTEGDVLIRAWRLPLDRSNTLATARALRPQLKAAGFAILFECADTTCGGFDFRYGTEVLPPPAMEVDLSDFRFIAARRGGEPEAGYLTVLISRAPRGGFVQAVEVTPITTAPPDLEVPQTPPPPGPNAAGTSGLLAPLERDGRVVLEGVTFAVGEETLGPAAIDALVPLAGMLDANPEIRVLLVGHTDDEGGLDGNLVVSRARAQAVRAALIETYGIAPGRLIAEGAGFMAPLAANVDVASRAANRRVEAVLLTAQ
ncbi:MAG: OmpA family protein [Pseudomonadota bacterium]